MKYLKELRQGRPKKLFLCILSSASPLRNSWGIINLVSIGSKSLRSQPLFILCLIIFPLGDVIVVISGCLGDGKATWILNCHF